MKLITGMQIKLARTLLDWTRKDLHHNSSTGLSTINRMEGSNFDYPTTKLSTITDIEQTLSKAMLDIGWQFNESSIEPIPPKDEHKKT